MFNKAKEMNVLVSNMPEQIKNNVYNYIDNIVCEWFKSIDLLERSKIGEIGGQFEVSKEFRSAYSKHPSIIESCLDELFKGYFSYEIYDEKFDDGDYNFWITIRLIDDIKSIDDTKLEK